MHFALQTTCGVGPWAVALALAAAPASGQARAVPEDRRAELQRLFDQARQDGPDSPVGRDLRRHQAVAVAFLDEVLRQAADDVVRCAALQHLMRMGAVTAPAVPTVVELLRSEGGALDPAILTLGEVGPFLASAPLRAGARVALEDCARRLGGAVPGRVDRLARAWSRLQVTHTRDVAELVQLLRSGNPFRIELGCQMLTVAGPAAAGALPTVHELLRQEAFALPQDQRGDLQLLHMNCRLQWTGEVREALFRLLVAIAPDDPAGVPIYLQRLDRTDGGARATLVQRLGRIGPAAAAAVPVLTELACAADVATRREAVTALGMIGAAAAPARTVLDELAGGDDAQLAARARAALRQIEAARAAADGR